MRPHLDMQFGRDGFIFRGVLCGALEIVDDTRMHGRRGANARMDRAENKNVYRLQGRPPACAEASNDIPEPKLRKRAAAVRNLTCRNTVDVNPLVGARPDLVAVGDESRVERGKFNLSEESGEVGLAVPPRTRMGDLVF